MKHMERPQLVMQKVIVWMIWILAAGACFVRCEEIALAALESKGSTSPQQIEISGAYMGFTMEELHSIPGLLFIEMASVAELENLRKEGKGVARPFRLVTSLGQAAVLKDVEEIIYPTEFDVESEKGGPSKGEGAATAPRFSVVPGAFETREAGLILSVETSLEKDGESLGLEYSFEMAKKKKDMDYGCTTSDESGRILPLPMKLPVFRSHTISSRLFFKTEATRVVSGGWDDETKRATYLLLRVRTLSVDATPEPVSPAHKGP